MRQNNLSSGDDEDRVVVPKSLLHFLNSPVKWFLFCVTFEQQFLPFVNEVMTKPPPNGSNDCSRIALNQGHRYIVIVPTFSDSETNSNTKDVPGASEDQWREGNGQKDVENCQRKGGRWWGQGKKQCMCPLPYFFRRITCNNVVVYGFLDIKIASRTPGALVSWRHFLEPVFECHWNAIYHFPKKGILYRVLYLGNSWNPCCLPQIWQIFYHIHPNLLIHFLMAMWCRKGFFESIFLM